LTFISRSSSR